MDGKALTEEFLQRLGFDAQITEQSLPDGGTLLDIECEDAELLLGHEGRNLEEMQYLINRMIFAQDREQARVTLDVGGYRSRRRTAREAEARAAAEKVRQWGDIVELEPMNSFERWVVHQTLKEDPAVETYSVEVEGTTKKVVILRPRASRD